MATDTSKTQYEQTTSDGKLVEEEIDPKILELLGIKDTFDFDYGDYKTLLREKMTELDMKSAQSASKGGDTKKLSDSQGLLIDEFKRVKRSTGKFKLKSKKVKAEKVVNKSKTTKTKPITDSSKLLPGSGGALAKKQPVEDIKPEPQKQEDNSSFFKDLLDALKGIQSVVKDLLKILEKQLGLEKKNAENQRRTVEKKEKKKEETDLEKKEEKSSGLLEKITKPFTSIFDTIKNFLLNVLLGSVVSWLLKVISNPMILLKPIQGLVDGIVGFFNTVIQFIDGMVVQPVRNFINMINSALKGFIDILNNALKMLPGGPQLSAPQMPNIPEPPEIQSPDITGEKKQQPPSGPAINLKFTGGQVTPLSQSQKKQMSFDDQVSRQGGTVSSDTTSYDVSGLGPDKHLTALSTGEYVLKKGAADWLGGPAYLDGLNKMFGGSTERKVASIGDIKVQAKSEGGEISFDPDAYAKSITGQKTLNVGSGSSAKRYAVSYRREGSSGTYTVKQINKVVQSAGLGGLAMIFGARDQLTGVNPESPEGKLVINSVALKQHFMGQTGKIAGPLKIQVDPQAGIYFAYKQAYNTHYNKWRNQGQSHEVANQYARKAAMEFAVARRGASNLPGSKNGLDASLNQVQVAGSPSDSSSAPPSTSTETKTEPSEFAKNFAVVGAPSIKGSQQNQPPGSETGQNKTEPAPTPKPESAKLAPPSTPAISPSSKPTIPQPPSNKPNIMALPIPGSGKSSGSPRGTGVSNHGSSNQIIFSSYRGEEPSLAVIASIYNMWGGL